MAEGIQDRGDVLQAEFNAETLEVPEIGPASGGIH
jgi:hypothetical protein